VNYQSIKQKILLPYCAIILGVTVVLGAISHHVLMTTVTDRQRETLTLLARATGEEIAQQFERRKERIASLAHSDATERYAHDYAFYSLGRKFAEHKQLFPFLTYVNELGVEEERMENGRVSENFEDISTTRVFREASDKRNETVVSSVEVSPGKKPYVSFVNWNQDFFGKFGGIIRGVSPLTDLTKPARQARVGQLGFVMVLNSHGQVLAYPDENRLLTIAFGDDDASRGLVATAVRQSTGFGRARILGIDGYIAYAPVPGTDWSLLVTLPYDEFVEVPNTLRNTVMGVTLATLFALIVTALLLSRLFTIPLRNLLVATEAITTGDFSKRANVESHDEFQILANAFNRMSDERQQAEATLREAKLVAEQAAQSKADFLAKMTHEFRTPMNAILGFTDVLRRGYEKNEAERRRHLNTIHSSGQHLLHLIDGILDLSKVEVGRMEIEHIEIAPHIIVCEVVETLAVKAAEKSISLELDIDGPIPETVLGDPTRMRQTITNLISNAVKFTAEGGVKVVIRMSSVHGEPRLAVDVIDNGIGIAEDKIATIFESFVQADTSTTRRYGGTGLGLNISRGLARLMGGDIVASSVLGEGSTFTATIDPGPLDGIRMLEPDEARAAMEEITDEQHIQWQLNPGRVLVVDDGAANRELVQLVLEEAGLAVDLAENGQIGFDMAEDSAYDVILMDMQMPVMNGYEATALLRRAGVETPIYALTANAMEGFEEECLAAGCTGYLTKPVDIDSLLDTLSKLLGGKRKKVGVVSTAVGIDTEPDSSIGISALVTGPPIISRLAGERSRVQAIIRMFVQHLEEKLDRMDVAWEQRDFTELAALAHWLKGSGGTVGFNEFTEPATNLEMLAKAESEDGVEVMILELRGVAERLVVPDALPIAASA
jgi:signal transduction histidine kinase/DNA-binding response OmpR family regulator